jgi:hypothetical protein
LTFSSGREMRKTSHMSLSPPIVMDTQETNMLPETSTNDVPSSTCAKDVEYMNCHQTGENVA